MKQHRRTMPGRGTLPDFGLGNTLAWYLFLGVLFLAPLPLGGNRPWAWSLLAASGFATFALFLLGTRSSFFPHDVWRRLFLGALVAWGLMLPLLQLVPLPGDLVGILSPGASAAWQLVDAKGWRTLSVAPDFTLEFALRQGGALVLAMIAMYYFRWSVLRWRFVVLVVVVASLNAILGLADYTDAFEGKFFSSVASNELALTGTYVNKNHFAGLLGMGFPLAVVLAIEMRIKSHGAGVALWRREGLVLAALGASILGAALLMSSSRGGILAVLGGLVVALAFRLGGRRLLLVVVATMVLGLCAALAFALARPEQLSMDALAWLPHSAAERIVLWVDTLRAARDYQLLGSGLGTYDFVFPPFKSAALGYPRFDHAHNDYLEFYITTGIVGWLVFAVLILSAFGACLRTLARLPRGRTNLIAFGAIWSVATSMLHALVDFNWQIPANFLYFLMMLALLASVARPAPARP